MNTAGRNLATPTWTYLGIRGTHGTDDGHGSGTSIPSIKKLTAGTAGKRETTESMQPFKERSPELSLTLKFKFLDSRAKFPAYK